MRGGPAFDRVGGLTASEWGQVADGLERVARMIWRGSISFPGKSDIEILKSAEKCSDAARWLRENYAADVLERPDIKEP